VKVKKEEEEERERASFVQRRSAIPSRKEMLPNMRERDKVEAGRNEE